MINIPSHSILIADAKYHLALYETIIQQKNNCIDVEVMTLSTFLSRFYTGRQIETIELLYIAKKQLETISNQNAFYQSLQEPDFLKACLQFLDWFFTYNISFESLPEDTQKEKDLKDILYQLIDLPISSKQTSDVLKKLANEDLSHVYILHKETDSLTQFWIDHLISQNAHLILEKPSQEKHYYTTANARKQAQLVCESILEDDLDANDILLSVDNESEKQVLLQMFEHYQIPYTLLSKSSTSIVSSKWSSLLNWVQNQNLESFLTMISKVYPYSSQCVNQYYQLFPEQFMKKPFLQDQYIPNELLDEVQFNHLQSLKEQTITWLKEHNQLFSLSFNDFKTMAAIIQESIPYPKKEDIQVFGQIQTLLSHAYAHIQNVDDLSIIKEQISTIQNHESVSSLQGVLIGNRKDLCSIRPIYFMLGATAKQFPKLSLQNGIFDETYFSKLELPSLQERIHHQRTQIFHSLSSCQSLYVFAYQSDYSGKSIESSNEMDDWMGAKATFRNIEESSIFETPTFTLDNPIELFYPNNTLRGSVSRLESFARCPLQHFLRYGLRLQEKKEFTDIRIRGSILHHVLENAARQYGKQYATISKEQIQSLVEDEFMFVKQLFPSKIHEFESSKQEIVNKLSLLFEQFAIFEENWHMNTAEQEYRIHHSWNWNQYTIDLVGFIDRIDTSETSFCIFDYKSSDKELTRSDFESGLSLQLATYTLAYEKDSKKIPIGNFYISLKTSPISQNAVQLKYRKPEWIDIDEKELLESYPNQKVMKGWAYQDISTYSDEPKRFLSKKDASSFQELGKEHEQIVSSILSDIESGDIQPNHAPGACEYCAFKSICRQSATEVTKPSRLEKEDAK